MAAQEYITGGQAYTILNTSTYTVVVFSNYAKNFENFLYAWHREIAIPKTLSDQFCVSTLITTANCTNTYKLGNINPICWLR